MSNIQLLHHRPELEEDPAYIEMIPNEEYVPLYTVKFPVLFTNSSNSVEVTDNASEIETYMHAAFYNDTTPPLLKYFISHVLERGIMNKENLTMAAKIVMEMSFDDYFKEVTTGVIPLGAIPTEYVGYNYSFMGFNGHMDIRSSASVQTSIFTSSWSKVKIRDNRFLYNLGCCFQTEASYFGMKPLFMMVIKKEFVSILKKEVLLGKPLNTEMLELWVDGDFDSSNTISSGLRSKYRKFIRTLFPEKNIIIMPSQEIKDNFFVEFGIPKEVKTLREIKDHCTTSATDFLEYTRNKQYLDNAGITLV